MITLTSLQTFLDNYLQFDNKLDTFKIDPFMANGLMVKGKEEIKKIGFGVSASLALFKKAKKEGCDALVVHHSFNLPSYNKYDSIFQNRIGFLIQNGMSLFGYHFLLDAHPQIGNNAQILKTLDAKLISPFIFAGQPWGWTGLLQKKKNFNELFLKLKPYLSPRTITYQFGPPHIRKIVAVSGSGAPHTSEMNWIADHNIDLYITGEAHEWNRELFSEAKIHFIAGGHYHTELFGIKALMQKVSTDLKNIAVEWLELTNEI